MASWSNFPTRAHEITSYTLMRCPPKGSISGVILSDNVVGTDLHFFRGRSTPCNHTDCEACRAGHRPRWKAYLYVMSPKTKRIIIIEFTERCMTEVTRYLQSHDNLRGAIITLRRTGNRPNSPLGAEIVEPTCDPSELPEPENLCEVLERMWEVREDQASLLPTEEEVTTRFTSTNGSTCPR